MSADAQWAIGLSRAARAVATNWPRSLAPRTGACRVLPDCFLNPALRTSRGIDGNCPRLPRLIHPCGGTPTAISHNPDPPGHGHGRCGRLPVQSQYPERMPARWGKEPLRQRWRVHTCALDDPPYVVYVEIKLPNRNEALRFRRPAANISAPSGTFWCPEAITGKRWVASEDAALWLAHSRLSTRR